MILDIVTIGLAVTSAYALPYAASKRHFSELRPSYDYIIAGGGTAGTVLVIEYGEVEDAPGVFDPPTIVWGGSSAKVSFFTFDSLPNPDMNDKVALVLAGKTVGGSSAINGMYFDRGSRHDYNAWARAGDPEFSRSTIKWDWDSLFPYFKKSVTFTEPTPNMVQEHGYTWDESAYGGTTPIYSSFPPFLWGDLHVAREAWKDMGIRALEECAGGDKEGSCWVPTSQHAVTARRSHAGLGHFEAVKSSRQNYDLLVKHQVIRVVYTDGVSQGPPLVEVRSLEKDKTFNMTAKAEVVISAGALHTPTILQRSGIGPSPSLQAMGIDTVLDLPGVGSNLQDHSSPGISWNYTKPGNFSNMPSDMLNPAYAARAAAEFNMTPARGPYTLAMSSTALYISLPNVTEEYMEIIKEIRRVADDGSAASHLPQGSHSTLVDGYKRQLHVLADLLANSEAPSVEVPFATGTAMRPIILHPLSRGTVRLSMTDHLAQPILDYRAGSSPIDFSIHIAHLRWLRKILDTPTMRKYGAVAVSPDPAIQSDEDLKSYVKESMVLSHMHPCCTAAMLPKSLGGVVGPDLKVHGAAGLRIVDISILPFLPSAHTSATALRTSSYIVYKAIIIGD
ncbi:hypothetical protein ACET3X_003470 [Alternaria dauci]|uniref:Glucose-methanol-choline oxidoreductase N-terminal domain-containing protein n=1 Tax=Alternaria dauci TaxID=48095 RepID=A0ABR3USM9_9PLEO